MVRSKFLTKRQNGAVEPTAQSGRLGYRLAAIASGFGLVVPAWIGTFSSGTPTLYSPFPTLTILPALLLSKWHLEYMACLTPTTFFFLWNPGLVFKSTPKLPRRTIALLAVLSALGVIDCLFEWNYGIQYHGRRHTLIIYAVEAFWLASLWWIVVWFRRKPSFAGNLIAHWLVFAWLGWYAFPYLGELP